MVMQQLIGSFKNGLWLDEIVSTKAKNGSLEISKKEFSAIESNLQQALQKNHKGRAVNWFALGLAVDSQKIISEIRRKGMFRASKYDFNTDSLGFAISIIVLRAHDLRLPPEILAYLQSLECLLRVSQQAKKINQGLILSLRRRSNTVLKSLIVLVDFLFMTERECNLNEDTSEIHFYPLEDLSEALSYLIHLFDRFIGIKDTHFALIDEKAILGSEFPRLLVDACKLKKLMDIEVLVDVFGYICSECLNSLILDPPDQIMEKSIRLGYILTNLSRALLWHEQAAASPKLSMKEASEKFFRALGDLGVTLKTEPASRIVVQLPLIPELQKILCGDRLFYEEDMILRETCKEQFTDLDYLKTFPVMKRLVLFDVLIVQRLFNFLRFAMKSHLIKKLRSDPELVMRSLVPVFRVEQLLELLQVCLSEETAEAFCEATTWNGGKEKILDLQYQPIIQAENLRILPTNIFGSSNLFRNVLYSHRRRLFEDGRFDPVQKMLHHALEQNCGDKVSKAEYKYGKHSGDIDVIALCGPYLLIFECKNSLLPSGAHELRTSYDHIIKAAEQLNRTKSLLENDQFVEYLFSKLGWQGSTFTEIVTCIVTGNRLFLGYRVQGHPVRPVYELCNIFTDGKVQSKDKDEEYCLWRDGRFEETKAVEYIKDDTLHSIFFESMVEKRHMYRFQNIELIVKTWALVPEEYAARMTEFWGPPIKKPLSQKEFDNLGTPCSTT